MQHTKKSRWLAILLVLVMVLTLLPTAALAANTQITTTLDFTADGSTAATGDGYSWDSGNNTLTLKGIDLSVAAGHGIVLPSGSTIVLEENTTNKVMLTGSVGMKVGEMNKGRCAIKLADNGTSLTIKGTGTLNAGSTEELSGGESGSVYAEAINAEVGTLTVEGGALNLGVKLSGTSDGVYVIDAKNITVTGGTITATGTRTQGDSGTYGIRCTGDITVTGGSILASGTSGAANLNKAATDSTTVKGNANMVTSVDSVTTEVEWSSSNYRYEPKGEQTVLRTLLFTKVGDVTPPAPGPDDTLYYDKDTSKLYTEQEYTNEVSALGASGRGATLTLNGFNFSTTAAKGLILPDGVTLTLVGDNSVTSTATDGSLTESYAVEGLGALTINGSGKLTAKATETAFTGYGCFSAGVKTAGSLTISGATVDATGGNTAGLSCGLYVVNNDLTLSSGAKVTAKSFNMANPLAGANIYGVYAKGDATKIVVENGVQLTAQGAILAMSAAGAIQLADGTAVEVNSSTNYAGVDPAPAAGAIFDPSGFYTLGGATVKYLKVPGASAPAGDFEGEGTQDRPFLIKNVADLKKLAEKVNGGEAYDGKFFRLENNLDLNNEAWTPIGTKDHPFKGTFNGNNKIISNLSMTESAGDYQGLFGHVNGGSIVRVAIKGGTVRGLEYVGSLVGYLKGGTVEECYNTAAVTGNPKPADRDTGSRMVGGLVGEIAGGTVQNCYNLGTVSSSSSNVGGIAGAASGGSTVDHCYNTGNVTTPIDYSGGIVGDLSRGTVSNCVSLGLITSVDNWSASAGRIAGTLGSNGVTLSNNKARADQKAGIVSKVPDSGGALGVVTDGTATNINGANVTVGTDTQADVFSGWNTDTVWIVPTGILGAVALPTLKVATQTPAPTLPGGSELPKVSIAWKDLVAIYDGETHQPDVSTLIGVAEGDTVTAGTLSYKLGNADATTTAPTAAGTYTVSATLTGANADKYTLTNPSATFIIQRAPVTFTVANDLAAHTGSAIEASVTAKANNIAFTDFTVTYRQGASEVASPTAVGSYDIYAEITDNNYRHTDTTDGTARKIGVLTIYENEAPATYRVRFASGGATGNMQALVDAVKGAVRIFPANGFTKDGFKFMGWSLDGRTYQPGDTFEQPEKDVTVTAVWQELKTVSGIVKQAPDNTPVEGAVVRLMLGSQEIAQTVSGSGGTYSFTNVTPGSYNLIASKDGITNTIFVSILADSLTGKDILLPAGKTNTVVEVEAGTPVLLVNKLDQFFTDNPDAITTEDQTKLNDGGSVEIKLSATVTTENSDIKTEAAKPQNAATVELYLDLDLTKTVKDKNDAVVGTTPVTETDELLSFVIQLPGYLQGRPNYVVFRVHNGQVGQLTTTANADGEYLAFNDEKTELTIFVKKFSTYGVGATNSMVTFDANGGTCATKNAVVNDEGKLTLTALPTATRSGYTFDGWYTAASGGDKIKLDKVYYANTTVYAHWTSNGGGGGGSSSAKYKVDVSKSAGGTVTASLQSAARGATVTVTVTPDSGYELGSLTVTDKDGKEIKLTDKGSGRYTFTMPGSKVSVDAVFVMRGTGLPFTDVEAGDWYYDAVRYVYENELMNGTSGDTFSPNMTTTRGMIATIIYRLEGRPSSAGEGAAFTDVPYGQYYTDAVAWTDANGVMIGYGDGHFGPDQLITREELALVLYRYAQYKGQSVTDTDDLSAFTDQPSYWAADAVKWAVGSGIMAGVGGDKLDPTGSATRAQAAVMLQRCLVA